ncbi:pentapeptide repeat-containing protein [Bradyrhizobium sp. McL0615]|uniref:pentapeptide repeat-containing protein n=1 Tax=Bradyrhizobium sp. McL0615 TaxID=3415673 RepID=UPI003CF55FB9
MELASGVATILVILFGAYLVWWFVPPRVVGRLDITNTKDRADVTDNYRKTIGQALGAIVLIVTFAWTFYKDRETIDLSRAQLKAQADQFFEQQLQTRDQFVNQQFIAASGLLKEKSVGTRIAGLYAIEQIAETKQASDGRNRYLIPAIRAAIGFIMSSGDVGQSGNPIDRKIPADVQSAISILASLNMSRQLDVDLRKSYLVGGDFRRANTKAFVVANFQGARLYGANMSGLDLTSAKFDGSYMADWEAYGAEWDAKLSDLEDYENTRQDYTIDFTGAILNDAGFDNVRMGGASLKGACLAGARFYNTDLSRAHFQNANLGNTASCDFKGKKAHFYKAKLIDADFSGVDVAEVNFEKTNLAKARFLKAINVDRAIFTGACVDEKTELSPSISNKLERCALAN